MFITVQSFHGVSILKWRFGFSMRSFNWDISMETKITWQRSSVIVENVDKKLFSSLGETTT